MYAKFKIDLLERFYTIFNNKNKWSLAVFIKLYHIDQIKKSDFWPKTFLRSVSHILSIFVPVTNPIPLSVNLSPQFFRKFQNSSSPFQHLVFFESLKNLIFDFLKLFFQNTQKGIIIWARSPHSINFHFLFEQKVNGIGSLSSEKQFCGPFDPIPIH